MRLDEAVRLEQVHGTRIAWAEAPGTLEAADAARTRVPGLTLTVRTADCLSVIFISPDDGIAVAHAGWRGLVGGILENTAATFESPGEVHVLFGPAIGPCCFEVGPEVAERFVPAARLDLGGPREHADLYAEARLRLRQAGIADAHHGPRPPCTKCNQHLFHSHRGSGGTGGRLITAARYRPLPR